MAGDARRVHATTDDNLIEYIDVSPLARRAGIEFAVFVEPSLHERFNALAAEPGEPLFRLLVPFRFVAARCATACKLNFVVGRGRICADGVGVSAEFRECTARGYYFVLSPYGV
jgi:hypothetical protein